MRGYVVDKEGKPIQFRVHDPSTGQTSMALLVVRGGAVSMVDVLPGQFSQAHVQHEHVPGNRVGAMPGEMGAPPAENGVVAARQYEPTGRVATPAAPAPAAAPAATEAPDGQQGSNGNDQPQQQGDRPPALTGAAADL